jgi:PilZ domain/SPOR domain
LNVSDGGLSFHSFDRVQPNGTVRFWFSDNNQRIEATGTVTWTDETQKGGLRFVDMPAEAREKIRDWIRQPGIPIPAQEEAASVGPRPRTSVLASMPPAEVASGGSVAPAIIPPAALARKPWSGFSQGLATGLLASAVLASGFLFHGYRSQLGELLIQLGERFAAKPQAETVVVSAAAPEVLAPAPTTAMAAAPAAAVPKIEPSPMPTVAAPAAPAELPKRAPDPAPQPERFAPSPAPVTAKPQPAAVEPAKSAIAAPLRVANPAPKAPVTAAVPAPTLPVPTTSLPKAVQATVLPTLVASNSNVSMPKPNPAPKVEPAKPAKVQTEDSGGANIDLTRELYFDVGKFKNQLQAHDETDKLAQLGLPVSAVQKGFLWTNSYHVLVGPYGDEGKAKVTQDALVSSGFKPRPFEKGWRTFKLISSVTLNGAPTPQGEYTISWESYIGNANVKFTRNSNVVSESDGKWVKRDVKYPHDEYVYRKNPDGSRTLLEIHFEGMRQALVFGKAS